MLKIILSKTIFIAAFFSYFCLKSMDDRPPIDILIQHAKKATGMTDPNISALNHLCLAPDCENAVRSSLQKELTTLYKLEAPGEFSPDGRFCAYYSDQDLCVVNAYTGRLIKRFSALKKSFGSLKGSEVRWSPGSSLIYDITQDGIQLYSLHSAEKIFHTRHSKIPLAQDDQSPSHLTFSADDTYYSVYGTEIINTKTKKNLSSTSSWEWCLFSPKNKSALLRIFFSPTVSQIHQVCLTSGTVTATFPGYYKAAFASDESFIVFADQYQKMNIYFPASGIWKEISQNLASGIPAPNCYFQVKVSADDKKIGMFSSTHNLMWSTEGELVYALPNKSMNCPPFDWRVIPDCYQNIYYSPQGTCAYVQFDLNDKTFLVIIDKNQHEYRIAEAAHRSEAIFRKPEKIRFHPTDGLLMAPLEDEKKGVAIRDMLVFQDKVSIKELLAYVVVRNAIKNNSKICPEANGILNKSNNVFLKSFAQVLAL